MRTGKPRRPIRRRRDARYITIPYCCTEARKKKLDRFWPERHPNRSAAIDEAVQVMMAKENRSGK